MMYKALQDLSLAMIHLISTYFILLLEAEVILNGLQVILFLLPHYTLMHTKG